jgi:hypothetical protein
LEIRETYMAAVTGSARPRLDVPNPLPIRGYQTDCIRSSPLPLLVTGIGAHDEYDASTPHDLALFTHATNAGANLHTQARGDSRPRL